MFYKKRLIDLREEKNLRQLEISKMLIVGKDVYGHYEREETIIPIKHLLTLCNYFDASLDYIFGFINIKQYENNRKEVSYNLTRDRLKTLRKEYKLTQKGLADSIGASKSVITDYERKVRIIATPFLYDICKKYNISADYLLGRVDSPKNLK